MWRTGGWVVGDGMDGGEPVTAVVVIWGLVGFEKGAWLEFWLVKRVRV